MKNSKENEKEDGDLPIDKNKNSKNLNISKSEPGMKEVTTPDPSDDILPDINRFLELTKNPVPKLRHGQGYDQELGLTYIGSYHEAPNGYYGISRKNGIIAIKGDNPTKEVNALNIRVLDGYTDPLSDKTLVHIRELMEELNDNGYIRSKSLSDIFHELISLSYQYLDFKDYYERVLFILWIIGTYLRALFIWYPYLCFEGLRDVGKSTALEFLARTCFNGGDDVSGGHTEANLHKAAASTMGCFTIDHMELRLKSPEKRQVMDEFLENAWKINSYVSKRDQDNGKPLKLPLACSVALGSRKTTETMAEKGFVIIMYETDKDEIRERSSSLLKDERFDLIERELMAVALNYQDNILEIYESTKVIKGLGREFNKFLPFFAITKVIDNETNNKYDLFNHLKEFAINYRRARKSENEDIEEVLLRVILRDEIIKTTYTELSDAMNAEDYKHYSWQTAKADMKKLGIVKKIDRNQKPHKIYIDLERAATRAKQRGIFIDGSDDIKPKKSDEIVKLSDDLTIDYRNITSIERNILTCLKDYSEYTYSSLIDELKIYHPKDEIRGTLNDMRGKGWI